MFPLVQLVRVDNDIVGANSKHNAKFLGAFYTGMHFSDGLNSLRDDRSCPSV